MRRAKYGPSGRPAGAASHSTKTTDAEYLERWKAKCVIDERGCWLWQGFIHHNGYPGGSSYRGKSGRIHRFVYQIHRGSPAPSDWDVCHTCDNRRCINPLHLFAGPRLVNMIDMRNKGRGNNQKKTHCPKGHEYAVHAVRHPTRETWRACGICVKERQKTPAYVEWRRAYQRRKREEKRQAAFSSGKTAQEKP